MRFRAQDSSGFRVRGSGFRVQGSEFRAQGSGLRVQGSGFRAQGPGFRVRFQFENDYFTEICSVSEAGSYLRLVDFVWHSTLGLRVIKKNKRLMVQGSGFRVD